MNETTKGPAGSFRQLRSVLRGRPLEELIGVAVMAALVLITLLNVLVRYFTSQSFAWTEEISVFLLVIMTLAGTAIAAAQDAHIRIEFFYDRGSDRHRRWLAALSTWGTACLFVLLAILLVRTAWSEFEFDETTFGLGVPRWWYTAVMPVLALVVAFRAIVARRRAGQRTSETAQTAPADGEPS